MLRTLSLKSLESLDGGRVATAFKQAVDRCVQDCRDRPGLDKARKVTLTFEVVAMPDEDGDCATATGKFQVKDSIPERKSKPYSFGVKHNGNLYFSDEDPSNIDQLTFDDIDPETGRANRPLPEDDE